jgi:hypothetical protein
LNSGPLVLTAGRPGLFAWFSAASDGRDWQRIDLAAHHNACIPDMTITDTTTSAYTEVVPLDNTHALVIYDRIPHGWSEIPKDSANVNSVWVVRVRVEETP